MERLQVQTFIPQRAVETLVLAVLPRASRTDVTRWYAVDLHHIHQELCDELRAVVTTNVRRRSVDLKQSHQRPRHELRVHPVLDFYLDTSPRELVDYRQNTQFSAPIHPAVGPIFNKIVHPHMIRILRLARYARTDAQPLATTLGLQCQSVQPAQPPHTLEVHTLAAQQ